MHLQIHFEHVLEGEALSHFLKQKGHQVMLSRNSISGMVKNPQTPGSRLWYLMDAAAAAEIGSPKFKHSISGKKILVIGGLKQLYLAFELNCQNVAYITPKESVSEVLDSLDVFENKQIHVSKRVSVFLNQSRLSRQKELLWTEIKRPLTKTEVRLLQKIGEGKTTCEIAGEWYRSIHTINNHRKNLIRKLGIEGAFGLVVFAAKKTDPIRTLIVLEENRSQIKQLVKNDQR